MSSKAEKIPGTEQAWEDGTLGADSAHTQLASPEEHQAVSDALNLQAISIRLPKQTIDLFKALAAREGIGYQPLMRTALIRFADMEAKRALLEDFKAPQEADAKDRKAA